MVDSNHVNFNLNSQVVLDAVASLWAAPFHAALEEEKAAEKLPEPFIDTSNSAAAEFAR